MTLTLNESQRSLEDFRKLVKNNSVIKNMVNSKKVA